MVEKATIEYIDCSELKKVVNSNNQNEIDPPNAIPKITILDEL